MPNTLERFNKRKKIKGSISMYDKVDSNIVDKFLNSDLNQERVDLLKKEISDDYDMYVSDEEAQSFLLKFKKDFNDEKFNKLINDCKKEVINSIVTPFGLGKIVAAYDKTGGNVDTIHNVRNTDKTGIGMSKDEQTQDGSGIYATDDAKQAYNNRGEYNSDEYHKDESYIKLNKKHSEARKKGEATDYMTGDKLDPNKSHDLDHVKSAKEIHDDQGRVLAEIDGAILANTDTNLKPTTATSNRSKKADKMSDFLDRKNERIQKINDLKNKPLLSKKEENELRKLEELAKIDDEKATEANEKAIEEIDKEIKGYYGSKKFVKDTLKTGANEGVKMGMQQALGLIITEFFTAVFDEILDIYKNGLTHGFDDERFFSVLKERLQSIGVKVAARWKDAAVAFKDGFISGFISNLVTTVINMFVTTGKRLVRIIREGLFSLFRAVKLLLFPPEDMTFEEAMHEAKKLIASGLVVSLGIVTEQWIDTLIKGTAVLEPFSDILTSIFIGAITGISMTMVVYYIDKKRDDKKIYDSLVNDTSKRFDKLDQLLNGLNNKEEYVLYQKAYCQVR